MILLIKQKNGKMIEIFLRFFFNFIFTFYNIYFIQFRSIYYDYILFYIILFFICPDSFLHQSSMKILVHLCYCIQSVLFLLLSFSVLLLTSFFTTSHLIFIFPFFISFSPFFSLFFYFFSIIFQRWYTTISGLWICRVPASHTRSCLSQRIE